MLSYFNRINQIILSDSDIYDLFDKKGYIRLNMVYIYPSTLLKLNMLLRKYGLSRILFENEKLVFQFRSMDDEQLDGTNKSMGDGTNRSMGDGIDEFELRFNGVFILTENSSQPNKLFSLEFDFEIAKFQSAFSSFILKIFNEFLCESDSFFFMTYEFDIDREILENPLYESIEYLGLKK